MAIRDNLFIRLLISAKDDASAKVKSVTAAVGGLVAKVVASAVAFLSFKGAIDAAEKLEVQMGKLRGAVAATGGAAGLTAEEIDVMARNLDEATLGGAANIRDAAAQLLTFKSVGKDAFERTLKAAQDLSSTGFGSVEQSAVQLGKALEDPLAGLGALTRVGVSFNASQKEQIENFVKLGQVAQAQNVILSAVEGQVQGVASAAGAGLAGAVDLVGKRFTDLKETVGGALIGVLGQLNLQLADFLGWANRVATGVGPVLRDTFVGIGISVTALGGVLRSMTDTLGAFAGAVATMDFSHLNQAFADSNLQIRGQLAAMAALSPTFADFFKLSADDAARLAALTGQVASSTQQAGAAAGAAAPQVAALANSYQQQARALELLQAVLDRRSSAQDAWNAIRREEAKLSGDISTQLALEIAIAEQDARTKQDQSTAAARLAAEAQRYYDELKQGSAVTKEAIDKAEKDAIAKQKQADATAAAASAAALYLKQARQAPQTQALTTQTRQLKIILDYETRIAAIKNKNLSQADRDAKNASAAEIALAKATLARLAVSDEMSDAQKKAAQESINAYTAQAEQFAGQVQDGEKAVSLLERLRDEKIKLLKQTADEADVKAMIEADDKPARKQAAAFIEWVGKQKAVLNVEIKTNKFGDGKSINSLVDGLTRGAAAQ